nr:MULTISPECIES: zinc ABC transporter substrate-binding protein ZnuA [Pseudomonas]
MILHLLSNWVFPVLRIFAAGALSLATLLGSALARADVQLLTSIKPLQLIAAAVQDGVGTPDVLLPPGATPHQYALRPSDIRRVGNADLFYWVGPELETFLPRVLADRKLPSVAVKDLPGMQLRYFGEGEEAAHAHEDEHAHAHENEHEHEHHDHDHRPGSLDAHLWLLPANAEVIAARMAADLTALDPANGDKYAANLQAFKASVEALDVTLRGQIEPIKHAPYFVFHEGYDYFEAAYGIKHAGVFSALSEVQPGARHVAAMRKQLEQAGPTCVFTEPPLRPRLADTLTEGLPVKVMELDPMGNGLAVNAQGYTTLLANLGKNLSGCLGGL